LQREIKTRLSKPACKKKRVDFCKIAFTSFSSFSLSVPCSCRDLKEAWRTPRYTVTSPDRFIAQKQGLVEQR
jgi:hypothetical protein